jgi:hypothetical protein
MRQQMVAPDLCCLTIHYRASMANLIFRQVSSRSMAALAFARPIYVVGFALFVGGYVGLLAWFKLVDVYHAHFSSAGAFVIAHNFFRVLFIFYLFWIVYSAGAVVVRSVASNHLEKMDLFDDLALNFFAGAGLWHVVLLVLGYLELYTVPVAIGITLPVLTLSFFDFCSALHRVRMTWLNRSRENLAPIGLARVIFLGLAVAAGVLLLLVKGVYPGGGHDYFLHYFSYYKSVIDHRGLWPNEVWYHYFYSKGAGLYFLGFLLTDPLAPQLVTFCFFSVAAVVVFRFVRGFAPGSLWPWVAIVLFLSVYIHTPGRYEFRQHGGWGDFEKLHELNAAFVIAVLWMTAGALERAGRQSLAWTVAAALAVTAAVIVNVTISLFLGAVFCISAAWYLVRRNSSRAFTCITLASVSGTILLVVLAINYFTTGLINDQGLLYFWPLADVEKLYRWGTLGQVMALYFDRLETLEQTASLSLHFAVLLLQLLRYYLLYPLFVSGFVMAIITMGARLSTKRHASVLPSRNEVAVITIALMVFAIVAFAGQSQDISLFRYSTFVVPILIVAGTGLWAVSLRAFPNRQTRWRAGVVAPPLVLAACFAVTVASFRNANPRAHLANVWSFVSGRYSIDQAYTMQRLPGRFAWGGIYPGARGAYQAVGPHTPIWSLHIFSYCMLPDCNIETHPAFTMGPDWDRVMFGAPDEAKEALQKAGINYFLFSRELRIADPLVGESSLFAPDVIGRHLGIYWTDGTTALLTWIGSTTMVFDQSWVADYKRLAKGAPSMAHLKPVFERLRRTPHPWQSITLPQ